jgi:hypothetical protein
MQRPLLAASLALASLAIPGTALADGAVRVLHASPNAPAVDVYVNGAKAVSHLKPGSVTPYLSLPARRYAYAVRLAGASATSKALRSGSFTVRDGGAETIAATGFAAGLRIRTLPDAAVRPFGAARIRVVHLSPDAPKIDVYVRGGGKVVARLRYPTASGYLTVPAGRYTFDVRVAGASPKSTPVLSQRTTLRTGSLYSAWAIGSLAKKGFGLRAAITQDRLPASFDRTQVRVLHAAPDAPSVDIYAGSATTPLIRGLAYASSFPAGGAYAVLPSGPISLVIRAAGADPASAPVATVPLTLPAQASLTVAARGLLAPGALHPFGLQAFVDDVSLLRNPRHARLTAVHLAPTTPTVDVFSGATAVFPALAYGTSSNPVILPAGTHSELSASPTPGTPGTVPIAPLELKAGSATTVYAIGLLGGSPALTFAALTARLG